MMRERQSPCIFETLSSSSLELSNNLLCIYERPEVELNDCYIFQAMMPNSREFNAYLSFCYLIALFCPFPVHPYLPKAKLHNDITTELNDASSITPSRKERPITVARRKQMLLTLLEALTELQKESESGITSSSA